MINAGEDLLICDLAETYGILDYKALRPLQVAVLASGLRDDSRIKMKIAGAKLPLQTMLLAMAVDNLSVLRWMQTEDARKGRNVPVSIVSLLTDSTQEENIVKFDSKDAFEARKQEVLAKVWHRN